MRAKIVLLGLLCVFAIPAQAAIIVLANYRLGENDPGAVTAAAANSPGANPTVDSVLGNNLTRVGAPRYSADSRPQPGSALSMSFDGAADRYVGAVPTNLTTDFGIEAWVKSNGRTTDNALLAYNGNTGNAGWGLFRFGNEYGFLYGGVTLVGATPVTTQWTHLALVREGNTTRFYVNGVLARTSGATPTTPAGNFMVAGNPMIASEFFDGLVDEVRVFRFQPGQFRVSDLNLIGMPPATPIPTTSPLALLALCALLIGLAFRRTMRA